MKNEIIIPAMETYLKLLDPTFPSAWDNAEFKPPVGPFQAISFLFAEPDDRGGKDSPVLQRGYMDIALAWPPNVGSGAANVKAKNVAEHFKRGTTIETPNFNIIVERTPTINGGQVEGDRFIVRVRIRWYAYIDPENP